MGQASSPYFAIVVEDDFMQRSMLSLLFEESDLNVFECETAEAALALLDRYGDKIVIMVTDIQLAGVMDGLALARIANQRFPQTRVIVTSGDHPNNLPKDAVFIPKPWRPLDMLRE